MKMTTLSSLLPSLDGGCRPESDQVYGRLNLGNGKGMQHVSETLRSSPVGDQSRPAKCAASRNRVLRCIWGSPFMRSVHREHEGRVMEPRKRRIVGVDALFGRGRQRLDACRHLRRGPTGVGVHDMDALGLPWNLGDPVFSVQNCGLVEPLI